MIFTKVLILTLVSETYSKNSTVTGTVTVEAISNEECACGKLGMIESTSLCRDKTRSAGRRRSRVEFGGQWCPTPGSIGRFDSIQN